MLPRSSKAQFFVFCTFAFFICGFAHAQPTIVAPVNDTPAFAPTPLSPGPHPLGGLLPILECIIKSGATMTAYFGFNNPSLTEDVQVPVGNNNRFVPAPADRSQTQVFLPGRSRYFPLYAFSVTIPGSSSATWQLNGYEVTADTNSNICNTDWIGIEVVVSSNTAPTAAQVDAIRASAVTQTGVEDGQITAYTETVSLGVQRIVLNVTTLVDGTEMSVTAPLGVFNLFGNNEKYTAFVAAINGVGLAPSSVNTLPTGQEVEGQPITSTPVVETPTNGTEPATPSSPSSPSTPSPSTPSSTPTSTSPTGTGTPSSDANMAKYSLVFVLLVSAAGLFF